MGDTASDRAAPDFHEGWQGLRRAVRVLSFRQSRRRRATVTVAVTVW